MYKGPDDPRPGSTIEKKLLVGYHGSFAYDRRAKSGVFPSLSPSLVSVLLTIYPCLSRFALPVIDSLIANDVTHAHGNGTLPL